jgi:hypothetical protein
MLLVPQEEVTHLRSSARQHSAFVEHGEGMAQKVGAAPPPDRTEPCTPESPVARSASCGARGPEGDSLVCCCRRPASRDTRQTNPSDAS